MTAVRKTVFATFDSAAARIRESLDRLDAEGEPLDAWQSDMFARALAYLPVGNYSLSHDAAFKAGRPQLFRTRAASIASSGGPVVTVAEIRAELDRVVAAAI